MNIYIRIEVLARELQGRLLLALVAAERGHEVLIGKHNTARVLGTGSTAGYPRGIFHDKSLGVNDPKSEAKTHLYGRGWGLTAQDEEHGLSSAVFETPEMISRFPLDGFTRNHLLFAWGDHDHAAIRRLLPNDQDRIVLTGSPRVDFWRPELRGVHDISSILPVTRGVPFVLFAPAGPPMDSSIAAAEGSQQHFRGRREADAAQWIARRNPRLLVVVRPHPAQYLDDWKAMFRGSPRNLVVVRDNRASVWVRNATAVISNGSTLAMEACLMGVPHINFAPDGDFVFGSINGGFTHQLGPTCTDVAALTEALAAARDSTLSQDWYSEEALRSIRARFSSLSGPLAADRIVDEWEILADRLDLDASESIAERMADESSSLGVAGTRPSWSLFGLRRDSFRRLVTDRKFSVPPVADGRPEKAPFMEKFPPFDQVAVEGLRRLLVSTTGRFAQVRMRRIHDRMLLLDRG